MNLNATLTPREQEITRLLALGATKKDVANQLRTSVRTVETQVRSIFVKAEVTKVNELTAWWFCKSFNITLDFSPLKRAVTAMALLLIMLASSVFSDSQDYRLSRARSRTCQTMRVLRAQRRYYE